MSDPSKSIPSVSFLHYDVWQPIPLDLGHVPDGSGKHRFLRSPGRSGTDPFLSRDTRPGGTTDRLEGGEWIRFQGRMAERGRCTYLLLAETMTDH